MPYVIQDLAPLLADYLHPTVVMWNRIEGRPRATKNFDRALKAEVRDALWMLSRQWQLGEFEGDDAGSPVLAKVRLDTTALTKYQADSHAVQPMPDAIPLEAQVEQKPLPNAVLLGKIALDLRLLAGRRWRRLLTAGALPAVYWEFSLQAFPVKMPNPDDKADAPICAHPETWQAFAAVAGRAVDGLSLYLYLKGGGTLAALPGGGALPAEPVAEETAFIAWFDDLFLQPHDPADNAWLSDHLEYQFNVSAPTPADAPAALTGEQVLTAREYYTGALDWYNFDIAAGDRTLAGAPSLPPEEVVGKQVRTLLPTPVMFDGMPNTRWWAFEEGRTNYGAIHPGAHELSKVLFLEFGLIYANDWYLIPFDLPVGTLAKVRALAVTNVFGEHFWLGASGRGSDADWQRWNLFTMSIEGTENTPSDTSILLLPTVPKIQESQPVETVHLIRDEMANMVWGIESTVSLPHGESVSGSAAAARYRAWLQKLADEAALAVPESLDPPVEPGSPGGRPAIRYEIMNQIPEQWIPFIPVHVENDNREIQLQRAALPRFLEHTTATEKVRPRTLLLQEGLAEGLPYYIHEEEVPRSGAKVYHSYQRTRWKNGKVVVWFGARKTVGHGQGSSGLAFDRILANSSRGLEG